MSRISDGLPLCSTVDSLSQDASMTECKRQIKFICRQSQFLQSRLAGTFIGPSSAGLLDSQSSFTYHYMCRSGVLFLAMVDSKFSAVLSFAYLSEVAQLFLSQPQMEMDLLQASRPYAFIRFEVEMTRCLRRFSNIHLVSNDKLASAQKMAQSVEYVVDIMSLGYQSISSASSSESLFSALSRKSSIDDRPVGRNKFNRIMKHSIIACWIYISFWNVYHDILFGIGLYSSYSPVLSQLHLSPFSFPSPLYSEQALSTIVLIYGLCGICLIYQVLRFFVVQPSSRSSLLSPSPRFNSKLLLLLHSLLTLFFLYKINNVYMDTGYNYFAYLWSPRIHIEDYVTMEKDDYRRQMSIPLEEIYPPNSGLERLPYQVYVGIVWMWIVYDWLLKPRKSS